MAEYVPRILPLGGTSHFPYFLISFSTLSVIAPPFCPPCPPKNPLFSRLFGFWAGGQVYSNFYTHSFLSIAAGIFCEKLFNPIFLSTLSTRGKKYSKYKGLSGGQLSKILVHLLSTAVHLLVLKHLACILLPHECPSGAAVDFGFSYPYFV